MSKVVICGRPNVGKSTLFNRLAGKNIAMVHDRPGITRDWLGYRLGDTDVELMDTAGMAEGSEGLAEAAWTESLGQLAGADLVIMVVDARAGLLPLDTQIATQIRRKCNRARIVLAINKSEGLDGNIAMAEFHSLGIKTMLPMSASHGQGLFELQGLIMEINEKPGQVMSSNDGEDDGTIRFAIIGRPNVGKSTLTNKLLGEKRMIVADKPGTTIDSVSSIFAHKGKKIELVDTAGIRRKANVVDPVEYRGTRQARLTAQRADVILFMVDVREGVVHQDQLLANLIADYGKATVVILNKSDLLDPSERKKTVSKARRKLPFMEHASMMLTSVGKKGFQRARLINIALEVHRQACVRFSANKISRSLQAATESNNPPRSHGKRPSLRYAHQAGTNPPLIVVHGRHVSLVKEPYIRYLASRFTKDLGFAGAPLHIRLKESSKREAH